MDAPEPDRDVDVGTNVEGEAPDIEPTVETDEATITDDTELERTLGVPGALVIIVGGLLATMSSATGRSA